MPSLEPGTPLPRTGFAKLDEAARRAPRALNGYRVLRDPTQYQDPGASTSSRLVDWNGIYKNKLKFEDIDQAYMVDSFARQGIDKYVELCTKMGWRLEGESQEPIDYLLQRFRIMGIMTQKPFPILIDDTLKDYIQYGNAFWIKKRQFPPEGDPFLPTQGAGGLQMPVLGYFRADPKRMRPVYSTKGTRLLAWEFVPKTGKTVTYPRSDIIHFPYNVPAGEIWGSPGILPVLEDIREYRRVEDYVIKLLYKHLNPLLHHEVPDVGGTGVGRQEDVDAAMAAHSTIAPDGFIITPPNHKIHVIGAESRALRGEGYMRLLLTRVYAGLGVNPIVMGEGDTSSAGSADAMTVTMHNRAKFYQRQLAILFTEYCLYELLLEGGFDPMSPLDHVSWVWNEIEIEAQLKRENHWIQEYTNGAITLTELRRLLDRKPMTDEELQDTHVYRVQIPLVQAEAEAKAQVAEVTAAARQVQSRDNPSNQHGPRGAPKIRPK